MNTDTFPSLFIEKPQLAQQMQISTAKEGVMEKKMFFAVLIVVTVLDSLDNQTIALQISNSNTARVSSTPILTNNRVRNSPQS